MKVIILSLLLIPSLGTASSNSEEIDALLKETLSKSREANGRWSLYWDRFAELAAPRLDSYDPKAVTKALYAQLKADAPLGTNRAIVAILVKGTKAFSPDTWLDRMAQEEDVFYHTSAMGIFAMTKFHNHPRFQAVLRAALLDKRIGLPPLSPSHTQNHVRVCDVAYNSLMEHRENKPPDYPIRIDMHRNRADALITDLRRELGIPDPPAALNGTGAPVVLAPKVDIPVRPVTPSATAKPESEVRWGMNFGMLLAAVVVVLVGFAALYLHRPKR